MPQRVEVGPGLKREYFDAGQARVGEDVAGDGDRSALVRLT
jgi:hypothetical protein